MNILKRDIEMLETVVDTNGNHWKVTGGFGMRHSARGAAIFGNREDGQYQGVRIEDIIDKKKTEQLLTGKE